jgi:hypothetical protein
LVVIFVISQIEAVMSQETVATYAFMYGD